MVNLKQLVLFSFLLLAQICWGSNEPQPAGARSPGMAGVGVTLSDVWAVTNNIAGITDLKSPVLGFYTENRFLIKAFSTVTFQGVYPLKKYGAVGLELSRFGDKFYNEQAIGLGFAHQIGPVCLGLKATLLQIHLEELGSKRTLAISFGGRSEIIPDLVFGAHVFNLNQAKIHRYQDERLPTVMKAGLAYTPGDKIILSVETEKNVVLPADFKVALEYKIIDKLALRTGFSSARQSVTGGVGFNTGAFQLDYALGTHSALGVSNHLSVSYQFSAKADD